MPANSFDGAPQNNPGGYYPGDEYDGGRHSHTTETEEEEGVIDQGDGYKLSIMRKKRPLIVNPDNEM